GPAARSASPASRARPRTATRSGSGIGPPMSRPAPPTPFITTSSGISSPSQSLPTRRSGSLPAPHCRSGISMSSSPGSRPTRTRWFAAPEVPTAEEAGVPGLAISLWHGMWAPKGTPKDIVAKLNTAVVDALADATVQKRFAEQGQEIPPREQQSPEGFAAYHKAEIEKWWPIIKAANIKNE